MKDDRGGEMRDAISVLCLEVPEAAHVWRAVVPQYLMPSHETCRRAHLAVVQQLRAMVGILRKQCNECDEPLDNPGIAYEIEGWVDGFGEWLHHNYYCSLACANAQEVDVRIPWWSPWYRAMMACI